MTTSDGRAERIDADVLVAGETLVDFLPPVADDLAHAETFTRRPGGAPANVAVGLSRLGRPPLFWTRVGSDPFGDALVETLDDEGVPGRFVEWDDEANTTLAFVERGDDPSFVFYREGTADTRLHTGRVPDDVLDAVEWVVLGGVALSREPARRAVMDLADRASARGCTVAFDPNARPELWDGEAFRETITSFLPRVDVLKATPGDLRAAGFEGDPDALAAHCLDAGPHTVLLTRGTEGALCRSTGESPWGPVAVERGAYDVDAVDPTGAGDAFLAGAVLALSTGSGLEEALDVASAVAALATTGEGAMTSLPDRETLAAFLSDRSG